ncbi:MAG: peptidoglycan DD-metalloendopeptidase family protein [Acidimicrobiia bacterium]
MRRGLAPIAVCLAALGLLPVASAEDEKSEVEAKISELASLIRSQEGRKSDIQAEITAAEERMREIRVRLAEAEAARQAIEDDITATQAVSERLQSTINVLEWHLTETRIELRTTRIDLRDLAVQLYVRGSAEMQGLVFGLEEVTEVAVGLSYAREAVADTQMVVRALEALKQQEQDQQAELLTARQKAEQQLAILEEQQAKAAAEEVQVRALQSEVESELSAQRDLLDRVEAEIASYESEKEHAEEELEQLEREIRSRSSDGGSSGGRLHWPVNAPVSSLFGPRVHPVLGSVRMHEGVDFRVGHGTPIRAAASGRVILAGAYGSYGNTTVIDHGGGLTTLYAHQSSLSVSIGQAVEAGQVIGYVGSTGLSTGAHLHFETRENGVPADPMRYFG